MPTITPTSPCALQLVVQRHDTIHLQRHTNNDMYYYGPMQRVSRAGHELCLFLCFYEFFVTAVSLSVDVSC